jgi:hypothetical protein
MVQCCPTLLPNHLAVVFLASLFAQEPISTTAARILGSNRRALDAQLHGKEIDSSRCAPLLRCQPSSPDAGLEQGRSGDAPPMPRLTCTVHPTHLPIHYRMPMRTMANACVGLSTITHIRDKGKPNHASFSQRCCVGLASYTPHHAPPPKPHQKSPQPTLALRIHNRKRCQGEHCLYGRSHVAMQRSQVPVWDDAFGWKKHLASGRMGTPLASK